MVILGPGEGEKREGARKNELEKMRIDQARIMTGSRDCEEEGSAGHPAMRHRRLNQLRVSPLHNKHSWVFGGGDANEPSHAHQAINPPHQPGPLLGLELVR